MKKVTFYLLIIVLGLLSTVVFGAIPSSERSALIALYNNTNGDNWTNKTGWKTPPLSSDGFAHPGTEEDWYGVTLFADHVQEVALIENNLIGSIPPGLGNLSNLEKLYLSNLYQHNKPHWNQLSGAIPPELGNLSKLDALILSGNQLSGAIPSELSNLSNLLWLHLNNNQLSGAIPPGLGNINKLRDIYLSGNQLSGPIPSELGNLSNLNYLQLDNNQLSGAIPPGLGNPVNLNWLYLNNNQLSGAIPSELGNLSNIDYLYLDNNQLSGAIPLSFLNLKNIYKFDISYNCLSASDPALRNWLNRLDTDWETTQCLDKTPPFGEFSTPIDGSTVYNSIPVTGWALDDIGISSVKIYNGDAYIGDAVFVEGARPDVEVAFPTYPNNDKAGWGYMLLTHFLPNGGNGTYTLVAKATDIAGNEVTLGAKSITIDNAHAVKPFGAIDTPAQGGTASGKGFVNFGWALTPQPNTIPIDGATINVIIDGVVKGHPGYNVYRSDIAGLFPGYANTNGAIGYYYIDTTKLTNGLHTIAWTVADNAENKDGIGSRYFTVTNPQGIESELSIAKVLGNSFSGSEVKDESAVSPIEIKELQRVEIKLFDDSFFNSKPKTQNSKLENAASNFFTGFMVVGNELRDLPIGSTLDSSSGIFYWQPGPGFVGEYRLLFVGKDNEGHFMKKNIVVDIKPL